MIPDEDMNDMKEYPYVEQIFALLKELGYKFNLDYDVEDDKATIKIGFFSADDVDAVVKMLRDKYDPSIVYDYRTNRLENSNGYGYIWIDQLPYWYMISPDDMKSLLNDARQIIRKLSDGYAADREAYEVVTRIDKVLAE